MFRIALLLLLVVAGCSRTPDREIKEVTPKFSFGQLVIVAKGFHKGASGRVMEFDGYEIHGRRRAEYMVRGGAYIPPDKTGDFVNLPERTWIDESHLEADTSKE